MLIKFNSKSGFSIIEVMAATTVISVLGIGIYRLELAQLSASHQALIRQLMLQSATNIANQIYAQLNYCQAGHISRVGGCNDKGFSNYAETSYLDHTSGIASIGAKNLPRSNAAGLVLNCGNSACTDIQYANFVLSGWKAGFAGLNIPSENIRGIVCQDNSFAVPTFSNPKCNGLGGLVIKMVWRGYIEAKESQLLSLNNYIILQIPQR